MLKRLPTKDRLITWGLVVPDMYVLWTSQVESHQHLFFECSYTGAIWSKFCDRFITSPPTDLSAAVSMCLSCQGVYSSSQVKIVMKLLVQVIVYSLWRERTGRIFRDISPQPMVFFKMVDQQIRDRLLSFSPGPNDLTLF